MEAEQIKNPEDLRKWLQSLPQGSEAERDKLHRLLLGLAHRASMRVLPYFWRWGWTDVGAQLSDSALVGLRCALISQIALRDPESKIDKFAKPAFIKAREVYDLVNTSDQAPLQSVIAGLASADNTSINDTINSTLTAAYMTFALGRHIEIQVDAVKLTDGYDALGLPLWNEEIPNQVKITERWKEIRSKQVKSGPDWEFWIDWYENSLHGRSQDWELLTKIAHIDPVEWDKGAEHVNALIADIRLKHIAKTRPLGEDAIEKGADGLWHRTGRSDIDPDILRDAIAAVEDELDAIRVKLEGPQANMFTALAADLALLEERLARYPDRPLRLHDTFLRVQGHIASNLASGELPDDFQVHDFYSTLGTASLDMRNACSKTNEVIQGRINARFAETDEETRANIVKISEAAAALSDNELGKEFREDAKLSTDPGLPESEKKPALYRLTTRLSILAVRAGSDIVQALVLLGGIYGGAAGFLFIVNTILAFLL